MSFENHSTAIYVGCKDMIPEQAEQRHPNHVKAFGDSLRDKNQIKSITNPREFHDCMRLMTFLFKHINTFKCCYSSQISHSS